MEDKQEFLELIGFINEVDYVPYPPEVYDEWPEPYRTQALKALAARIRQWDLAVEYQKRKFE